MRTFTVTLTGASRFYAHTDFINAVREFTKWSVPQASDFIRQNDQINFNKLSADRMKKLFALLESGGFKLSFTETRAGFVIALSTDHEDEVIQIRKQLNDLSARLERLENRRIEPQAVSDETNASSYDHWVDQKLSGRRATPVFNPTHPAADNSKRVMSESNIGQYWLSRIGVFTLLLGVAFLITYTSSFMGKWGKLLIGGLTGVLLVMVGNGLVQWKKYEKWSMAVLGGGWAIVFFTLYAAHHVEAVRVVADPFTGLMLLIAAAFFSIIQSLQYRSPVLVCMSYFLAFVAIITTNVTVYTLIVSFLLALSMLITIHRMKQDWIVLIGLVIVYGTHWVWLEPMIALGDKVPAGHETFVQALFYPFVGNMWGIYPLIPLQKSMLHLAFLFLYLILFCAIDFLQGKEGRRPDRIIPYAALSNSLIFTLTVLHHFHVYFPHLKYGFTGLMAAFFFAMHYRELYLQSKIWPDVYLSVSAGLLGLMIPMYFDGSSVTYGWATAAIILLWLGLRKRKTALRMIALLMGILVLGRLLIFDFRENDPVFAIISLNGFFFIGVYCAVVCLIAAWLYRFCRVKDLLERQYAYDALAIAATVLFSLSVLMGGPRELASFVCLAASLLLFFRGVKLDRQLLRFTAIVLIALAGFRYLSVDFRIAFDQLSINHVALVRYLGAVLMLCFLFAAVERIRSIRFFSPVENRYFTGLAIMTGLLYMSLVTDKSTDLYRSVLWGTGALAFLLLGFLKREKVYRWTGLGGFVFVLARLFLYDFAKLDMLPRILSFMGVGAALIVVSLIYTRFTKMYDAPNK